MPKPLVCTTKGAVTAEPGVVATSETQIPKINKGMVFITQGWRESRPGHGSPLNPD